MAKKQNMQADFNYVGFGKACAEEWAKQESKQDKTRLSTIKEIIVKYPEHWDEIKKGMKEGFELAGMQTNSINVLLSNINVCVNVAKASPEAKDDLTSFVGGYWEFIELAQIHKAQLVEKGVMKSRGKKAGTSVGKGVGKGTKKTEAKEADEVEHYSLICDAMEHVTDVDHIAAIALSLAQQCRRVGLVKLAQSIKAGIEQEDAKALKEFMQKEQEDDQEVEHGNIRPLVQAA